MITKKLLHDIQAWLNSFYDFKNKNNDRNKHIIYSIQNFTLEFILITIRIWSLRKDGSIRTMIKSYSINIGNKEDFEKFKDKVDSTIDNYIKIAIEESR